MDGLLMLLNDQPIESFDLQTIMLHYFVEKLAHSKFVQPNQDSN